MRIVLFHDEPRPDALPDERDVAVQMDAIGGALADLGHESVRIPCTLDLGATSKVLHAARPDVVFNLVESINGQGRLIHLGPSLLEALQIPFTGCSAAATFITSCKPLAKHLLTATHIATPVWHTLEELESGTNIEPGRYILKSSWEHASRGLDDSSIVEAQSGDQLAASLRTRLPALAGEGFAEAFIEGREFNLSILAGKVLHPAEITFEGFAKSEPRIVGYSAKWDEASREYTHTPRRFEFPPGDSDLLNMLTDLAGACWRHFNLRGYARVDFRVDSAGRPWVLEINSNPCLSPDAGFTAAVARAGLSYTDAIQRILDHATPTRAEFSRTFRDEVRPRDAAAVHEIVASTGFFHNFEVDVAVELVLERLARGIDSDYFFLFADDDATKRTIGYVCFGPIPCTQGSCDLYWIAVHQDFQKRGLGAALVAGAESVMRGGLPGAGGGSIAPGRRIYIETSSQLKYRPTHHFYERCGYAVEARLTDFYAPGDDKLVYVKAL